MTDRSLPTHLVVPKPKEFNALPDALQAEGARAWEQICERFPTILQKLEANAAEAVVARRDSWRWLCAMSPFLVRTLMRYGEEAFDRLLQNTPLDTERATSLVEATTKEQDAMAAIRRIRHIEMARIAALDLLGELSVAEVLECNTVVADTLINAARNWSIQSLSERYGRAFMDGEPQQLWVIAMGKLGGRELNFSSDIDLIFCFANQGETQGGRQSIEHSVYFTKVAQQLTRLLNHHTIDGQAFRVDLRLRPFGNSGPVVTSISALEDYYQEQGRNWERYAMVKSRLIGAEDHVQQQFAKILRPFVYRRYLDYSAIDALRKMKLLINQESKRKGLELNVKLGIGGIREVEFVAQVFQLIRGGREQDLQTRSLVRALNACGQAGVLDPEDVEDLLFSYAWLRKLEHVVQQLDDEQTQDLPTDSLAQTRVRIAMGHASWPLLLDKLRAVTGLVHQHFLDVIGGEAEMQHPDDSEFALLWQDLIEDATAVSVLEDAGAEHPEACWQRIRSFRENLRRRSSGPRGRELLASLVPWLIESLVGRKHTDITLQRVFDILEQISSRTTYLELLTGNPGARNQLVSLCEASPWVAHLIARFPMLLDELIDPAQLYDLPDPESYRAEVGEYMNRLSHDDPEIQMDALRQVKQVFQLRVAAADLSDGVHLMRVSDHLTYLAEAMTEQVVLMAWQQLAERHGTPPGRSETDTGFMVVAYGKLGGYELGYGSDLDLVFICADDLAGNTDGPKPIETQQFYLRLAQRVLHLFTTRTLNGVLYEVDMRLRPSGQSGLMVVRQETYRKYLDEEAWTWELQALVRARPIFGTKSMVETFHATRHLILGKPRELSSVRADIVAMRERMRAHLWRQKPDLLDIKHMPGGMTDLEFVTQFLVLTEGAKHSELVTFTDNIRILEQAATAGCLDEDYASGLIEAYQTLRVESHRLALAEKEGQSERSFEAERALILKVWQQLLEPAT
ncbi:MAG: bifunctional [glutamate--ammonia ligase]-adenylyl-L-tyrosine phosphorylase/[glutamate--ammonia-ligase] adenylyltransferase [Idiomarina sp.]|nr:bifunctional [glutamate--ammonia ligase]-adenylyl-L-tyrosine phosphorylase/[glutamate--ammonia-ligase] adenylyltransferase [Idiomarina sp.]